MHGWIKIHRKILDNPVVTKTPEHFYIWMYLLLNATHRPIKRHFDGKTIVLKPGEMITGRKKIAAETGVNESKVTRVLKDFEIEQQIEQQKNPRGRVISILAWDEYQQSEQQNEQQMNTIQEYKNIYNNNLNISNSVCVIGKRPHTHPYGKLDNVYLTASEYQDLKATYLDTRKLINKVSLWLTEHERKNHYAVCLKFAESDSWARVKPNEQEQIAAQEREQTPEEKAETARIKNEVLAKIGRIGNGGTQIQ